MTHPLQPNQKPDLTTTVYVDYPRYKINKEGVKKVVNSADEEKALGEGWYNNRFDAGILPRPGEEFAPDEKVFDLDDIIPDPDATDEDLQGSETESADDEGSENADETASESESDESETGKKKKKKKK